MPGIGAVQQWLGTLWLVLSGRLLECPVAPPCTCPKALAMWGIRTCRSAVVPAATSPAGHASRRQQAAQHCSLPDTGQVCQAQWPRMFMMKWRCKELLLLWFSAVGHAQLVGTMSAPVPLKRCHNQPTADVYDDSCMIEWAAHKDHPRLSKTGTSSLFVSGVTLAGFLD